MSTAPETPNGYPESSLGANPNPQPDEPPREPRVEDYLDRVYAGLVPEVPYARRQELRAELAAHFDCLIEAYEEMGRGKDEAVSAALRQFGRPERLAREWTAEWRRSVSPPQSLRPIVLTTLACIALAELGAWYASSVPAWDQWEGIWVHIMFVAPFLSGLAAGFIARGRTAAGACIAFGIAVLATVGVAPFVDQSRWQGWLVLALVQLWFWMPIGTGAAVLGSRLRDWIGRSARRWAPE